eukprot:TRINITY_DN3958_c0_g1_i1.p1 TRINITY_DN3958_c0_g1~~TRINITY_DN3958_c0_g1_i1.p1  ORF type:complete len:550 (-),score=128.75 TRINITY_DN3958_c0_g1_i1:43-1668(-)
MEDAKKADQISEQELLNWCQDRVKDHVNVENFTTSWIDGLAFCTLLRSYNSAIVPPIDSLHTNPATKNINLAFSAIRDLDLSTNLNARMLIDGTPDDRELKSHIIAFLKTCYNLMGSKKEAASTKRIVFRQSAPEKSDTPEFMNTFQKIQMKRYQRQEVTSSPETTPKAVRRATPKVNILVPEKDAIRAQRIAKKWLSRYRTRKWRRLVDEWKKSPLTREAKTRYKLWHEIIDTEISYFSKLMYIIQKYKVPLENLADTKEEVLSRADIEAIFGNIVEVKNCSQLMVKKLNSEVAGSTSGHLLGSIFSSMIAPLSKAIVPYILNFDKSREIYGKSKKNAEFVKFEKECEKDARNSLLTLEDILIMPIQRVTKYTILFGQLKKLTPKEHVDYKDIVTACAEIDNLCTKINQQKKRADMLEQLHSMKIETEDGARLKTPVNLNWTAQELLQRLIVKMPTKETVTYGVMLKTKKSERWLEPSTLLSTLEDLLDEEAVIVLKSTEKPSKGRHKKSLSRSVDNKEKAQIRALYKSESLDRGKASLP